MRIPNELIKSVGLVSRLDANERGEVYPSMPLGTAFIVGVRVDKDYGLAHFVTAAHVAEAIEPAEAVIVMNAKDGAPLYLRTGEQSWFYHPTEKNTVDVAVMPFGSVRFADYDITWIPDEIFATDQRIADFDIGLGDELIVIGLFSRFFGSTHVIPIVRTGNIAMMPRDKVPTDRYGDMEAYLAEGRSIGGLSGSPVFVRNTMNIPGVTPKGTPGHVSGLGSLHLLGLMHGHWDLPVSFSKLEKAEAVNMGVSIVIPAKKILEVLHHPELVAMRKEHYENEQKEIRPVADVAGDNPFTRTDFEETLRKGSGKKSGES
jgi:hypothetical protein